MTPPFGPILLNIGDVISVHWYGVLIVTGIILGANVAAYLAKRAGKDPEIVWDMLIIVVVLAFSVSPVLETVKWFERRIYRNNENN